MNVAREPRSAGENAEACMPFSEQQYARPPTNVANTHDHRSVTTTYRHAKAGEDRAERYGEEQERSTGEVTGANESVDRRHIGEASIKIQGASEAPQI